MSTTVENIEEICASENNSPGQKNYVAIVEACGVVNIPNPVPYVEGDDTTQYFIDGDIELKPGYVWRIWNYRTQKDEEPFKFEDGGDQDAEVVNGTGSFFVPGVTAKKKRNMNRLKYGEWLVLFWDENNPEPQLIGEKGKGVTLRATEQRKPKNGYIVNATSVTKHLPYFYRGAIAQ